MNIVFLQSELNRVSDWIRHLDNKANILSALYIGLATIFGSSYYNYTGHFFVLKILFILFFIFWFITLFISLSPKVINLDSSSVFFFWTINKMGFIDFNKKILTMDENAIMEGLSEQIYTNSIIASHKAYWIKVSLYCFMSAIVCLLACLFWQNFYS